MTKGEPTMEETLISFSTAKLAKEKGFDWKTDACYIIENKELNYDATGEIHNHNEFHDVVSAPTQSLLQRWLREKRKIYISIKLEIAYIPRGWYCYIDADSYRLWGSQVYKTYEKALGVGLIKALKLI